MEKVTVDQCKDAIRELNTHWVGHHRCGICNHMVGYVFEPASSVYADPSLAGLNGDDLVVGFNSGCGCSSHGIEIRSWEDFAECFNMQTPEVREKMWARFKAGGATHESGAS